MATASSSAPAARTPVTAVTAVPSPAASAAIPDSTTTWWSTPSARDPARACPEISVGKRWIQVRTMGSERVTVMYKYARGQPHSLTKSFRKLLAGVGGAIGECGDAPHSQQSQTDGGDGGHPEVQKMIDLQQQLASSKARNRAHIINAAHGGE